MRTALCLLSLLLAATPHAQHQPAADFASVLKATYSSRNGTHTHGHLGYGDLEFDVWLPNGTDGIQPGEMAVLFPDGTPLTYAAMTDLEPTAMSSIFTLDGDNPQWPTTLEPGLEYRYVLTLGDARLVDFPFTASVSGGDDPYTTSSDKTWRLETGPWFTHSLFEQNARNDASLTYFMWVRDASKDYEVSIRRRGEEVAWGIDDSEHPMRVFDRLYTAASRAPGGAFGERTSDREDWSMSSVTPGTYQVVVTSQDGDVVSEQTIEGGDGTFLPHTRSALDTQPRSRFLTPVAASTLARRNARGQHNLFWLAPEE